MIRDKLWAMLVFTRIPGNAFSFWIRQTLRWSRGTPRLPQEAKDDLFAYLGGGAAGAESREAVFRERFRLDPLAQASTAALYRKNLYLLETLEKAADGLPMLAREEEDVRALDVGSQDWHYVFALERWLRYRNRPQGRRIGLAGIELDGYGIYADFFSRRDYAQAYAAQTGNPEVLYQVGDFLASRESGLDVITLFYPFVTRYQLLLWGLPLRFFSPRDFLSRAAALTKPGGWLMVFCHTSREHELFLELGRATAAYALLREGPVHSDLVDFHEEVADRRFSVWRKS